MKKFAALLVSSMLSTSLALGPGLCRAGAEPDERAVVSWLRAHDYGALEQSLSAVQQGFEAGRVTEAELRRAFQPFAALADAQALQSVRDWAAQSPQSYVAHLALGLSYRAQGSDARGRKFWDDTLPERREGMLQNFALAEPELRRSVALTARPYLSLLNLMSIAANLSDRPVLHATLLLANEALPHNRSARLQYARFLLPRWGGSYEQLDGFMAQSRAEGVDEATLLQMQAIELNDQGLALAAEHHATRARPLFRQALQLAREAGDVTGFRASYLSAAIKHVCQGEGAERDDPVCSLAHGDVPAVTVGEEASHAGPGEDPAHAIVMPAVGKVEGVRAEYAWLALRYPDARRTAQALVQQDGHLYDALSITTADHRDRVLYFDITAFADAALQPQQAGQHS